MFLLLLLLLLVLYCYYHYYWFDRRLQALQAVSHLYQDLCHTASCGLAKIDSKTCADVSAELRQCLAEACTTTALVHNSSAAEEEEVSAWLSCAECMLDSFSAFGKELPASARSAVPLTGEMLILVS